MFFSVSKKVWYQSNASLVGTLTGDGGVIGVAVLDDEVFVTRFSKSTVEVYCAAALTLRRKIPVAGLSQPTDMAACRTNRCVYVGNQAGNLVHRVDLFGGGDGGGGVATTKWSSGSVPNGLSVTAAPDATVLVTCRELRKVREYTTYGDLVRIIFLHKDMVSPLHCVRLPTTGLSDEDWVRGSVTKTCHATAEESASEDRFVVSHGYGNNPSRRVCLVDAEGRTSTVFDGKCFRSAATVTVAAGSRAPPTEGPAPSTTTPPSSPTLGRRLGHLAHLAVDASGHVLVADSEEHRVLLLNPSLTTVERVLLDEADGLQNPVRLCLDEQRRRLFVGSKTRRQVIVFEFS